MLGTTASAGLAGVVARCTHIDPVQRYQQPAQLAEDLRRHLADLPLRWGANSLGERWRKWRRRRAGLAVGLRAALLLVGGLALGLAFLVHERALRGARADLEEGQEHLTRQRYTEADRAFSRGLARLGRLPGTAGVASHLSRERRQARRGTAAAELNLLVGRLRLLAGAERVPAAREWRRLDRQCQARWGSRGLLVGGRGGLSAAVEEGIQADLQDLVVLWAGLRVRAAGDRPDGEAARREALRLLEQAVAQLGPGPVLAQERAALARQPGRPDAPLPAGPAPRTAWEHAAVGRSLLRHNDLASARRHLEQAVALAPRDFWSHYYHGVCCHRLGAEAEALAAFHVCVALAPQTPECYYNRGLVWAALKRTEQALKDYDRALALDAGLAVAALNRGVLRYQRGDLAGALDDLRQALRCGADPVVAEYHLAVVHEARGERDLACRHAAEVLRRDPAHAEARALQARVAPHRAGKAGGGER
jgi:tetratricopeptide (TPR) repeat protein